jgi:hypothetical protein
MTRNHDGEQRRGQSRRSRARSGGAPRGSESGSREEKLQGRVRHLLAQGELPREPANQIIAGFGDGAVCRLCERPVVTSDVAYELTFGTDASARKIVMHYSCFILWDTERVAPET